MFRALLTQPIFNLLLVLIAFVPGNDFGIAIILLTILIRFMLYPVTKKQLHQQKAMRELQPEIAKVKKQVKGDKQKEAQMLMELYKEREINPLAALVPTLLQLPILIALFFVLRFFVEDNNFETLAYGFLHQIPFIDGILNNQATFDTSFLGVIDLGKKAVSRTADGSFTVYWQAIPFVVGAAGTQFIMSKQLAGKDKDKKSLRQILNDAKQGKQVDQAEQTAAMTKSMTTFLPILTLFFASSFPAALSLYWMTSSGVAALQQRKILNQDVEEMAQADVTVRRVVEEPATKPKAKPRKKKGAKK